MDISFLKRKNFNANDFFKSDTAIKNGILNIPRYYKIDSTLVNLELTANKAQEVRELLDKPVIITSGFRCLELNRLLKSKDTSDHVTGCAIDFKSNFGSPEKIVLFLKEKGIEVNQCIVEKSWVHLSIKAFNNRNQFAYLLDGKFTVID